jgi:hypothetical protein
MNCPEQPKAVLPIQEVDKSTNNFVIGMSPLFEQAVLAITEAWSIKSRRRSSDFYL